mmetsp:Transcript_55989/g.47172  ORF Transcript_55989/g.47172 Transcript_55989/m.47172 type:complete len:105 (+) Transcript_55989:224-538(+)
MFARVLALLLFLPSLLFVPILHPLLSFLSMPVIEVVTGRLMQKRERWRRVLAVCGGVTWEVWCTLQVRCTLQVQVALHLQVKGHVLVQGQLLVQVMCRHGLVFL